MIKWFLRNTPVLLATLTLSSGVLGVIGLTRVPFWIVATSGLLQLVLAICVVVQKLVWMSQGGDNANRT